MDLAIVAIGYGTNLLTKRKAVITHGGAPQQNVLVHARNTMKTFNHRFIRHVWGPQVCVCVGDVSYIKDVYSFQGYFTFCPVSFKIRLII